MCLLVGNIGEASTSGLLIFSATISARVQLGAQLLATAKALDLTSEAIDLPVAVLSEDNNSPDGYKIKAKSINGGKFANPLDDNSIGYTMKYGAGSSFSLSTNDLDLKTQKPGSPSSGSSSVTISYPATKDLKPAPYSDLVTFTIEPL